MTRTKSAGLAALARMLAMTEPAITRFPRLRRAKKKYPSVYDGLSFSHQIKPANPPAPPVKMTRAQVELMNQPLRKDGNRLGLRKRREFAMANAA